MNKLLLQFDLSREKEEFAEILKVVETNASTRGANLWILMFAIFVASLGLNVNATAVVIGAMLISPLMGPIMGMGLGMGTTDLGLLRRSLFSYLFSTGVSLITSTLYFSITPINAAHSEILARTSPNIYDVLIAFFGGLAGSIAVSCKHKGNVIPGVAIATALMPPLCTAGYGLATFQMSYFAGAFYLFLINTVFIALATVITARLLHFPHKQLPDRSAELKAKRIAWGVVLATLLPSIYFGYDIVQQERFSQNANRFVQNEAKFPNDYLLKKEIDAEKKHIHLVYGGKKITPAEIAFLESKQAYYGLEKATLTVQQGFEFLSETKMLPEKTTPLQQVLVDKDAELSSLKTTMDSLKTTEGKIQQLTTEVKVLYPQLQYMAVTPIRAVEPSDQDTSITYLVYLQATALPDKKGKVQIQSWLEYQLKGQVKVLFDK